ncbi:hypothetical protein GCM10023353_10110 [Tomitella cavernea]|uniref:Uncharacterized protein n=1 Tax=Tomitella cavernea TaxID=1387982 RepID=A0ABP9CG97_9ACTN
MDEHSASQPHVIEERWAREHGGMASLPDDGFIAYHITGVFYPRLAVRPATGRTPSAAGASDRVHTAMRPRVVSHRPPGGLG